MKKGYLISTLLVGALLLVGAGCQQVEQNSNDGIETNTVSNTNREQGEIDISDWLTYENEEYGFSFQYPSDWEIVNSEKNLFSIRDSNLKSVNPEYYQIQFSIKENLDQLSLKDYYIQLSKDTLATVGNYFEIAEPNFIYVDDVESVQFKTVPGPIPNTLTSIPLNNYILEISRHNDNDDINVYKAIIDTIEFY